MVVDRINSSNRYFFLGEVIAMELANRIEQQIKEIVAQAQAETPYREPLVGFASAQDPLFKELKEIIGPHHLLPGEMLAGAKTVVAFFLPFGKEVVTAHRRAEVAAREWAVAYVETNRLIGEICQALQDTLGREGIQVAFQKATHNFDPVDLKAAWSHKSAAVIAGLGRFGHHRLVITKMGCAGRFGSFVIDAEVPPTNRSEEEFCLYKKDGKCLSCVKACPPQALTEQGLDKKVCYRRLLEVGELFRDIGLCDVCGKCAMGPCAYYQ
jgi:epoxyqueuosine reductase